ncbi:MAG: hypothetical protein ABMA64_15885 [Myxococcota bacterium]
MLRPLPPRVAAAALLAVLLVAGLWPYHDVLGWLPWGSDAVKWVGRGDPANPGWAQWVFGSKHFVGYRPVTALSFTLNDVLGGASPFVFRSTDLLAFLASGAALFAAHRKLSGDRSALALVPVLLVFAHPTTEEIVPFAARRSYTLAATFGLGAVVLLVDAGRSWVRAGLGALALTLAVLSNEVAYVLVPLVPWFVSRTAADLRRVVAGSAPALVGVAVAIALRWWVLGTLGGYNRRFFAFVRKGVPVWIELKVWKPDDILAAAWSHTVDPISVVGAPALFHGALETGFGIAAAVWIAWIGLVRPAIRRGPETQLRWALSAWIVGALAIVVLSQTWFWRQAHGVLVPLSMLLALELRAVAAELRAPRPWRVAPAVLALALLGAAALWNGPLVRGLHRQPHQNAIEGTPIALRVRQLLEPVGEGSMIYLAVPLRANAGHLVRKWADQFGYEKRVECHLLAHTTFNGAYEGSRVRVDREPLRLHLSQGMTMATVPGMPENPGPEGFDVTRLWRATRPTWLFAVDTRDAWGVRVPAPPPGVEPLPDPGEAAEQDDLDD